MSRRLGDSSNQITFLDRLNIFYRSYVDHLVATGRPWRAFEVAESSKAQVLAGRLNEAVGPESSDGRLADRLAGEDGHPSFLSFWLSADRVYAWGIPSLGRGERFFESIPLSRRSVERAVTDFRGAIERFRRDDLAAADSQLRDLKGPILRFARGSNVVLSLDGALHELPFDALLSDPDDDTSYLIRSYAFSEVPSLNLVPSNLDSPLNLGSMLLVGDIPAQDGYDYLSNSPAEIESIKGVVGIAEILSGERATADRVLEKARGVEALHFAVHADPVATNPLDSILVLNDSLLPARRLVQSDIPARLVTLSACRSVGGDVYAGEGPAGLAWAFLRGGAENVVASLWNVNDQTAPALMQQFYSHLAQGKSPSDALRQAKLWSIGQEHAQRTPYAWAVFQIYVGGR